MLLLISVILLVLGLIVVYAISPGLSAQKHVSENYYVGKQLLAIGLGVAAFCVVANLPLKWWRRIERPLLIAAGASAIAVRMFGERVNGAYRWIQVGGLSFQSAELIKFALLIWLAGFLSDRIRNGDIGNTKKTVKPLIIALVVVAIVVGKLQSDLGSTAVIVAIMAAMVYVAGLPLKRIAIIACIVLVGVSVLVLSSSYRRQRLDTFLNPSQDCLNTGYQACQALIGTVVLVGLFAAFFARLKRIIERAPDIYSRLLVTGILAWLSTQTIINIGAMIGLLPLKGITLPFISYGGTSILFVTAAIGIAFQVSRYTTYGVVKSSQLEGKTHDDSLDGRRLRGAYHPNPSGR